MLNRLVDAFLLVILTIAVGATALAVRNAGTVQHDPAASAPRAAALWDRIASGARWLGPPTAETRVVLFADFACAECRRLHVQIDSLRRSAPDRISGGIVHFPRVAIHRHSFAAALLVECASAQEAFESVFAALLEAQRALGVRSAREWATDAGVADVRQFEECVDSEAGRDRVEHHVALARMLKLAAPPRILVNGVLFPDGSSFEDLAYNVRSTAWR